ncbi:MAG: protein-L-isoaspartate(D-aspartate) O-methyltransferase [Pseudomonadota bacterium]
MVGLIPDPLRAARLILKLRRQGITDDAVLSALETVDRGAFVERKYASLANDDCSVPIACGQIIPRPLVTAQLLSALRLSPAKEERVLLIGSGSGYTAALLSHSARHVYGIERYKSLAELSQYRLKELGIENITIRHDDGLNGLPEHGPFDRILLTGAVTTLPRHLIEQIASGGYLVAPINQNADQILRRLSQDLKVADSVIARPLSSLREGVALKV